MKDLNTEVLAVSTDDLTGAKSIADGVGVDFPILYDISKETVKEYGVFNLLGDGLATASTFVIDKAGRIRWKYVGHGISDRPSSPVILKHLMTLEG